MFPSVLEMPGQESMSNCLDHSPESQRLEAEIPLLWKGKSSWIQHILWIPGMLSGALVETFSVQTKLTKLAFSSLETIVEWTHCMRTAQQIWPHAPTEKHETSPHQPPNQKNTRQKNMFLILPFNPPYPQKSLVLQIPCEKVLRHLWKTRNLTPLEGSGA